MLNKRASTSVAVVAVAAAIVSPAAAQGIITDDFHTGDDSIWYTRHDPLRAFGAPGTWSFPPGAYRMQGDASPDPATLGVQRVFSTRNRTGSGYDNPFTMGVDVVDWNPAFRTSIGLFTNVRDIGVGTTDYYFTHVDVGGGGASVLAFDRVVDDLVTARTQVEIPALTPDHDYSLVIAPSFSGSFVFLYDRADLVTPIAYFRLIDSDPLEPGLLGFGTTGIFGTDPGGFINSPVDATFDNFVALPGPATGALGLPALALAVRRRRRAPN